MSSKILHIRQIPIPIDNHPKILMMENNYSPSSIVFQSSSSPPPPPPSPPPSHMPTAFMTSINTSSSAANHIDDHFNLFNNKGISFPLPPPPLMSDHLHQYPTSDVSTVSQTSDHSAHHHHHEHHGHHHHDEVKYSKKKGGDNINNNDDDDKKKVVSGGNKKPKFAFQTRSQVDILDDGYRWRKYGQKAVKNNKFPRSYYRCTYQGCNVKKQVQRLSKDEGIVVTTYEGVHSHSIDKSTDNFDHILNQMHVYTAF